MSVYHSTCTTISFKKILSKPNVEENSADMQLFETYFNHYGGGILLYSTKYYQKDFGNMVWKEGEVEPFVIIQHIAVFDNLEGLGNRLYREMFVIERNIGGIDEKKIEEVEIDSKVSMQLIGSELRVDVKKEDENIIYFCAPILLNNINRNPMEEGLKYEIT